MGLKRSERAGCEGERREQKGEESGEDVPEQDAVETGLTLDGGRA